MNMTPPNAQMRFHAVKNNGGVDLTVIADGQTLAVIRLSASELEELVRTIDHALNNGSDEGENGQADNEE